MFQVVNIGELSFKDIRFFLESLRDILPDFSNAQSEDERVIVKKKASSSKKS